MAKGTVFKITPSGALTTLHSFDGADGSAPTAPLVQGTNGHFYGTTSAGGADDRGTIFEMTPAGTLETLHSFDGTDGADTLAGLTQASNGNLYGTAASGGSSSQQICQPTGCGTIFKITTAGTLTVLHDFQYYSDGAGPSAPLILATDGNLYGTTAGGTAQGGGAVFKIAPGDVFTKLHAFGGPGSGSAPLGGLFQATNGILYGTTAAGEIGPGDGTVFTETLGARWFVSALPTARKVGQSVIILGTNLTGSTSVTFNGAPAAFTVVSGTEITTTVPTGATTGTIEVTTPIGKLKSYVAFRVLP